MRAVGDRGVSTAEDKRPGLSAAAGGLRGGLGGSSLTCTRGLLGGGLRAGAQASAGTSGPRPLRTTREVAGAHRSSVLLLGEAKGLLGASSVMSEMMGPELETTSGE